MKKIALFFGVLGLAIILSGCGQKNQEASKENQNQEAQKTDPAKNKGVTGGVIDSAEAVKNAILGGQTLECNYTMKGSENMGDIKGYIDGKKYKSSFAMNGEEYTSIMDGEMMYSWSNKTKQGTKMGIQCMQDLSKDLPQGSPQENYESPEDMTNDMMNISCQPTSNIDFTIPKDIVFSDTCKQLQDSMQQMKKFQSGNGMPNL